MKKIIRLWACCMALLMICLASSCGQPEATAPGPPVPTPLPPPTVNEQSFTIVKFESSDFPEEQDRIQRYYGYLQELLNAKGWGIKFTTEAGIKDEEGNLLIVESVEQAAAVGRIADGYVVTSEEGQKLQDAGHAMDISDIVGKNAPALYSRYQGYFDGGAAGLPLWVSRSTKGTPYVLYLQKDRAPAEFGRGFTTDDVLALLERDSESKIGIWGMLSSCGILDAWAGEQGYYPLQPYGIFGVFYARFDDPACTPVPVEDISGFADFYDRVYGLIRSNRLEELMGWEQTADEGMIGYIGGFGRMYGGFLCSHQLSGKDYLAIPLVGSSVPAPPHDQPVISSVLAVYPKGVDAGPIIDFVQWALTSREGYDLMNYGAEGVDYRLADERLEYLNGGNALTSEDWKDPISSKAYYFLHGSLVQDAMMDRISVYAPGNYEAVAGSMQPVVVPIWNVSKLRGYGSNAWFDDIWKANDTLVSSRYGYLDGYVPGGEDGARFEKGADCRALLKGKAEATGELAKAYGQRIKQLIEEQGAAQ